MHRLDAIIDEFHLLKHPFYQQWMAGTLTRSQLQQYAAQYYPHVAAFPTYVSAVHSLSNDLELRKTLLENLIEEERGEEHHPELWLRFAEATGLDRGEVLAMKPSPAALALVETFRSLTRRSVASGLGALYAYESQVPAVAQRKIDGLKAHYGVTKDRGLQFFSVHLKADEFHSASERDAIDGLSEREQKEAGEAARTASKALWDFLSSLN